jgi:hypothetical protein
MLSWERAPDWVRETTDRCLHDMQQPSSIDLRFEWSADDALLVLSESGPDGSGGGFSFSHMQARAAVVDAFAHFLQDQIFWESRGAWAEPRPLCPGHSHPATPTVVDDEAWWTCPESAKSLSRIGSYEHPVEKLRGRSARRKARRLT